MDDRLETIEKNGITVATLHRAGKRRYQEDRYFVKPIPPRNPREMPSVLKSIFAETAEKARKLPTTGGSTATVAIVSPDNTLITAHLGDSPAVLFLRNRKTGKVRSVDLLVPHDGSNADEVTRVKQEGGALSLEEKPRLMGGTTENLHYLSVTRRFNNKGFTGLSDKPDIQIFDISRIAKSDEQVFLAVSTDGVISDAKNIGAKDFETPIKNFLCEHPNASELQVAECMANIASTRTGDNQTILLTELKPERTHDIALGVFDGHGNATVSELACAHIGMEITRDRARGGPARG